VSGEGLGALLGNSPAIVAVRKSLEHLLQRQTSRRLPPILIEGETGTGKGLLARVIHQASSRAKAPFVEINCAAIPETMLEAELFGYERGAFTDARHAKPGLFQTAHRGTLFLDEVGLLPTALQAKVLKSIEDLAVRRLGSTRVEPVDVWILAATNSDLKAAIARGQFREDLYHRLAVVSVALPPLRARVTDIPLLARRFLARACADYGLPEKTFSPDALAALEKYPWPGNVRELSNVIERVALLSDARVITTPVLGLETVGAEPRYIGSAVPQRDGELSSLDRAMADHLLAALRDADWNISRTAARLGIARNTLRARMAKYGLRPSTSAAAPASPTAPRLAIPALETAPTPDVEPRTGSRIKWERRRISLLRVALEPQTADALSDRTRALEEAIEIVHGLGGRLQDLSPDGMLAAFGLDPVEDAPRRAALAAMAIQQHARRAHDVDTAPLSFRLAIHTTPFLIARTGSTPAVSLASARDALAFLDALPSTSGAIIVSRAAAVFLDRGFELRAAEEPPSPTSAFLLLGRSRSSALSRSAAPSFVGRDGDLETLHAAHSLALGGEPHLVDIEGEPGIGKSRLVLQFCEEMATTDTTILQADCASYGTGIPYLPVAALVKAACQIGEADTPDMVATCLHETLDALELDAVDKAPWLLHLLDPKRTDLVSAHTPEVVKHRAFEAVRELLLAIDRRRPLVAVIEDLHWIDDVSEEFLKSLAARLEGSRMLVITTRRPSYPAPWSASEQVTRITLTPLEGEPARALVTSLLGESVPPALIAVLLSKAEGNPFFLEECARTVRERPDLSGAFVIPDTVHEVLLARIDRLPLEERRLLQTAAAIGRDVSAPLLGRVTGGPSEAVSVSLGELERAGFLVGAADGSPEGYVFKHALTQDVAYESLLPEARRELHAALVEVMEKLYSTRLLEEAERLGDHAFKGGLWGKAVDYLHRAARKALSQSAFRQAVASLERAVEALSHLPETPDTLERGIDLRLDLRTALHPLGEQRQILDHLTAAEGIAQRLGDQRRLAVVAAYHTDVLRMLGDHDSAVEVGSRATTIARQFDDVPLQVTINTYVGLVHYARGEYGEAIQRFRRNIQALTGPLAHDRMGMAQLPSVHSRMWAAWCLAEVGQFPEAIARAREALEIAKATDHPLTSMLAHLGLGRVHLRRGDFSVAIIELEAALELSREWNIAQWYPAIAAALGYAYVFTGRTSEAVELLEHASAQAATMGRRAGYPFVLRLADAYLAASRPQKALELARDALELARSQGERGQQAWTLHLLGEVWSQLGGDDAGAEAYYRQASTLAEDLGMRPLLAHCHLGLAKLLQRTGTESEAARHFAAAASLFRELDMPFWLGQIEQASSATSADRSPRHDRPESS
jgi:DNA-binding NtrC family response regulator/tetratricopeptide (TPR) repeat protein